MVENRSFIVGFLFSFVASIKLLQHMDFAAFTVFLIGTAKKVIFFQLQAERGESLTSARYYPGATVLLWNVGIYKRMALILFIRKYSHTLPALF